MLMILVPLESGSVAIEIIPGRAVGWWFRHVRAEPSAAQVLVETAPQARFERVMPFGIAGVVLRHLDLQQHSFESFPKQTVSVFWR